MKKALSLLLAALLLAGCAAQPAPESAASPPPDSVAVESPSRPLATPSGEGAAQASQVVETTLSSGVVVQAEVSYPPVDFSMERPERWRKDCGGEQREGVRQCTCGLLRARQSNLFRANVGGAFCEGEQWEGAGHRTYDLLRAPAS